LKADPLVMDWSSDGKTPGALTRVYITPAAHCIGRRTAVMRGQSSV
jgi:hypothetical protein